MASAGAIRAARAYVELSVKDMLDQGLSRGEKRLRVFARTAGAIGGKIFGMSAAGALPMGYLLRDYAAFSDRVAELRTVSQATAEQMERLVKQANSLGTKLGIAPIETVQVQIELAKGGVKADAIARITRDVLALKTAAGQDVDTGLATQIGLDTLAQFKLPTDQFSRVGDAYVAAANASTTSVVELAEGMKYAAPAANLVGESVERTAAALAVLASQGIKGEQGGTALRNAYLKLADPKVRKELQSLTGVMSTDATGNMKPIASLLVEIGNAIKGMPNAKRLGILDKIFGERALFAATGLGQGGADFKDMLSEIEGATGIAARTAEGMADSLGGSFRETTAQARVLGNTVGKILDPALRGLLRDATAVASQMTQFAEANPDLVRQIVASGAAVSSLSFGLMALGAASRLGAVGLGLSRAGVGAMISPLLVTLRTLQAIQSLTGGSGSGKAPVAASKVTSKPGAGAARASNALLAGRAVGGTGRVLASPFVTAAGLIKAAWQPLRATGSAAPGVGMAIGLQAAGATAGRVSAVFGFGAKIAGTLAYALTRTASSTALIVGTATRLPGVFNPAARVAQGLANTLFGVSVQADFSRRRLTQLAATKMPQMSLRGIAGGAANALGGGIKAVAWTGPRLAVQGLAQGLTGVVPLMGRVLSLGGLLFSPTGLLIGGLALATAGVVAASGGVSGLSTNFGALLSVGQQAFSGLASGASRTWSMLGPDAGSAINLVTQRIASGDWSGALSAGVAGLKLVWADVVAGFSAQWAPLMPALTDIWTATVGVLTTVWDGFKAAFTFGIDTLKGAWQAVMAYFGEDTTASTVGITWADMLFGVQATLATWKASLASAWDSIGTKASNIALTIKDLWGRVVSQIAKWLLKIPGMAKLLGGSAEDIVSEIDADQKRSEAARQKQREANNEASAQRQADIEAEKNATIQQLDANREEKRAADAEQVQQAQADAEYDRLMALQDLQDEQAKKSPEQIEAERKKVNDDWAKSQQQANQKLASEQNLASLRTSTGQMGLSPDIAMMLQQAGVQAGELKTKGTSVGTFSGRAAQGLGASTGFFVRIAKATEKTADNTKPESSERPRTSSSPVMGD